MKSTILWSWTIIQWANALLYLSTNIPACTAWTMLRNLGFSSERRTGRRTLCVKVDANQSVTSEGTPSDCSCWRSSSVSRHCLREGQQTHKNVVWRRSRWKHWFKVLNDQCLRLFLSRKKVHVMSSANLSLLIQKIAPNPTNLQRSHNVESEIPTIYLITFDCQAGLGAIQIPCPTSHHNLVKNVTHWIFF